MMATNRTRIRRAMRRRLDAQSLAMWQTLREIAANPTDRDEYEPIGRHAEFIQLNCDLCRKLERS